MWEECFQFDSTKHYQTLEVFSRYSKRYKVCTLYMAAIGPNTRCNISNPTMRTGLDFKSAQFDQARDEAEDWIKMRGLEI
jgi:hypothetical protein